MNKTIERLIGKDVTVTLCSTIVVPVKGKLIECDDTFLVVEQNQSEVLIPLTSVLHVVGPPVGAGKR
ncbi:MAG TPA: hypothetical protein PKM43_06205 [Verrucomicrobiota bacterium]|nr:hypothetical protein [Verrucomicrobiota bacterium]